MTGEHAVLVGCDERFLRQPRGIQVACLGVVAGLGVFAVGAWADWRLGRLGRLSG